MAGDETTLYDLRVTVERIEGRSVCGLEVGDYFELTESSRLRIPEGRHFCIYALQSVIPLLAAKQRDLAEGDWLDELGVDTARPALAVREAWEIVRRLLAGDESGFDGERFSMPAGARLNYEVERAEVPLLVGTWSPRLAAFAGEQARELKIGGSANPALVPLLRERIGNDEVGIVLGAVTVVDEDGDRARALARERVAMYVDVVARHDPTRPRADDLQRFAFAGTPADVVAQAEALFDAGALRVDFGVVHGFELLCREVVPRLT